MLPTVSCVLLIAQIAADPISGGAGWIGAGLLGAVLAWLMFVHLPGKDKLIRELQAESQAFVQRLMDRHDAAVKAQQEMFTSSLRGVTDHCSTELDKIASRFSDGIGEILQRLDGDQPPATERRKKGV